LKVCLSLKVNPTTGSLRLKVYPSLKGYGVKSLFISWRGIWD
jgi:hypothetical protein